MSFFYDVTHTCISRKSKYWAILLCLSIAKVQLAQTCQWKFIDATKSLGLDTHRGWWNSVALGDFDADGLLDIVIVDGSMSRLSIMRLLPRALRGRHIGNAAVRVERTSWLRIESLDGVGQVLHADGERLAHTPAMLQVIPEALTVLAPRPLDP